MKTIIALGANLGDPASAFDAAEKAIGLRIGEVLTSSARRQTEPLLDPVNPILGHPPYLNSVIIVETRLDVCATLRELLDIESTIGRVRGSKWEPRVIDLDLIAYEDQIVNTAGVTVPHPEMHKRRFVLEPLAEIWPLWRHPVFGKTAAQMLEELDL
jgi:2-amino-4-hydroxy-6-hydroxymethyldihydropteridine diphosphokinase